MKPDWLNTEEYPFTSHYFTVDGNRLHYVDEGIGDPILFVHGTPSWSFDFRYSLHRLSDNYRCIAMDHLGFGLSDKPKNHNYSPQQHAQNLEAFMLEKNLRNITLVVHDFGGPIGLSAAMRHPERIKKIVVLNSWLWNTEDDAAYKKMKPVLRSPLLPILYRYLNFSASYLLPASFGKHKLTVELKKQYTKPFSRVSEREGPLAFARSLLNDQPWFASLWEQKILLENKPILLIWGMADKFITPDYLQKFRAGFPAADILELADVGHFPQEEAAEEVTHAIERFIEK